MERRDALIAAIAFVVTFALVWGAPASLAMPTQTSVHGEREVRTLTVTSGNAATFSWTMEVGIGDPQHVSLSPYIPMSQNPTRDAGRGADTRIELLVNGESAYRFRFGGTDPGGVTFGRVPSPGDDIDWSALNAGKNTLTFYANFSFPEGGYPKRGSVEVSAGPATLEARYADKDGDMVADARQPVAFLPTYIVAAASGFAVAGLGLALLRWRRT